MIDVHILMVSCYCYVVIPLCQFWSC